MHISQLCHLKYKIFQTIGKYLTPAGYNIDGVGVRPYSDKLPTMEDYTTEIGACKNRQIYN